MAFYQRIGLASILFALLTGAIIWRGPQIRDVSIVDQGPNGNQVSPRAAIRITFSRMVDRRSAEQHFVITPVVPGRFTWQDDRTFTFRPSQPLNAGTFYHITISNGMRDARGRGNIGETGWPFQVRPPRLLAVTQEGNGTNALWLLPIDGSEPRRLLELPETPNGIAVAPDGNTALVVQARAPNRTALTLVDLADGSSQPFLDDLTASLSHPRWAPLGERIAYERRVLRDGVAGPPQIWLVKSDGSAPSPLQSDETTSNSTALWSPDGGKLAYMVGETQALGLYDTFDSTVRTFPSSNGAAVTWAPDGQALVYVAPIFVEGGTRMRLRRLDLTTGAQHDLLDDQAALLSPAIAPDGSLIAFVQQSPDQQTSTIQLLPPAGGEARQLTARGGYQDLHPTWSLDSRRIAFIRTNGAAQRDLYLADVADGTLRHVRANVVQVVWAP